MSYDQSLANSGLTLDYNTRYTGSDFATENSAGFTNQDINIMKSLGYDTTHMQGNNASLANQPSALSTFSQGVGALGSLVSLAGMLNNWGVQKDAIKTNIKSVEQNMAQSKEAFERDKDRQDRSRKAVAQANREAKALN